MKPARVLAWWRRRLARRREASVEDLLQQKLRRGVRSAVSVLREAGLARCLRDPSGGATPWYLMLSESGAGKSSALRASGFEPISALGDGDGLPTLVEAWCSGQAVTWELSARALGPEPATSGARAVLRELSKQRPRRPLDGVILVLSADRLFAADLDREELAERMRAWLDWLQPQLGLELPVYLLVTKLDLVPDFVPFWSGLEPELCQQPWGASWQEQDPAGFGPMVAAEMLQLGRVLHARALHLACSAGARARPALFGFPERFSELGVRLSSYVQALTERRPCRPRVLLRGFYLCSAQPLSPDAQAKGCFFRELFQLAILTDRGPSRRSPVAERRDRLRRAWLLAAILAGSLGVVVPASLSQRANLELIASTRASLQPSASPEGGARRSQLGAELDPLLAQLERLEAAAERLQIRHWWGPYSAPGLRDVVARTYWQQLTAVLNGPVQDQALASLRSVGDVARFDWAGFQHAARGLKLYLMLSHPERLDVDWAIPELTLIWQRARQRGACAANGALEPHARRWLASLADGSRASWSADEGLVRGVQSRLASLPVPDFALAWLAEQAAEVPAIRAGDVFDARAAQLWSVNQGAAVPGVYTRTGWEKVRSAVERAVVPAADHWLFGQALPPAWARERLQLTYFERYARAWREFSKQLGAGAPALAADPSGTLWADADTLERIELACEADGPLPRLFQRLEANARLQLGDPLKKLGDQAVAAIGSQLGAPQAAPLSPVEQELGGLLRFGFGDEHASSIPPGSALSEYQKELRALLAALRQPKLESGAASTSLVQLSQVAQTVERLLAPLGAADRDALQGLLLSPIERGLAAARLRDAVGLAVRWRTEIVQPAQRWLERYPFESGAAEDVPLADLQGFFAPHAGTLWKFVETDLGTRVLETGGGFEHRRARGEEPVTAGVLDCLNAARELREAWFGPDGKLSVSFAVRLSSAGQRASALTLNLDEAIIPAAGELEQPRETQTTAWSSLRWPGAAAAPGAAVQLHAGARVDELRRPGPFGWLRLLAAGGLRPVRGAPEPGLWEATWQLNHGQTSIRAELRWSARGPVFSPALFEKVRCPAGLFASPHGDPA